MHYVSRYVSGSYCCMHRECTLHTRIYTAVHTCVEHHTAVNAGNDHKEVVYLPVESIFEV